MRARRVLLRRSLRRDECRRGLADSIGLASRRRDRSRARVQLRVQPYDVPSGPNRLSHTRPVRLSGARTAPSRRSRAGASRGPYVSGGYARRTDYQDASPPEQDATALHRCNTPCTDTKADQTTVSRRGSGALFRVGLRTPGPAARHLLVVAWIPDRPTLHDAGCNPTPFRDLGVRRTNPVDRYRGQSALLAVARETEPAVAVLGSDRSTGPGV